VGCKCYIGSVNWFIVKCIGICYFIYPDEFNFASVRVETEEEVGNSL
jgi:hypothetical protein